MKLVLLKTGVKVNMDKKNVVQDAVEKTVAERIPEEEMKFMDETIFEVAFQSLIELYKKDYKYFSSLNFGQLAQSIFVNLSISIYHYGEGRKEEGYKSLLYAGAGVIASVVVLAKEDVK